MERKWETRAAVVICAAAGVAAALLGARLLFGVLLPFVLAWGLSLAVAPAANALAGKTSVPRKVWAVLLLVLTLGLLVAGISAGVARGIRELEELLAALLAEGDYAGSGESAERAESGEAFDWFGKITAGVGLFRRAEVGEKYEMFREEFNAMVGEMLSSLAGALSAKLPGVAGKLISAMPSAFLFVLVTVIAGFYFCVEPGQVGKFLTAHLPRRLAEKIPSLRARAKAVSLRYLRAYLLILFVTFVQLYRISDSAGAVCVPAVAPCRGGGLFARARRGNGSCPVGDYRAFAEEFLSRLRTAHSLCGGDGSAADHRAETDRKESWRASVGGTDCRLCGVAVVRLPRYGARTCCGSGGQRNSSRQGGDKGKRRKRKKFRIKFANSS